ncbi:hypothetical protein SNOG_06586 [Parastagonospora nodorum SN15]|uniref:J domain-containing protein n=1 Tax=Phaeosphaeria nodorum (strain SN15 / ATCC MYA-4574 / FGSC 10173) TaxID=321614 RepID=Q0UNS8_PHANO|nr:hypothetical protein SNOG_06586 [Parastagonospora nodorum SN15]EAT86417.1 hypothetical protein SNOG_06586 [Parastagonospora nodorum SN15]
MARTSRANRREREEEEEIHEEPFVNDDEEDDIGEEEGPPSIDPYEELGLETEATADDVKKAYRKLALIHHPDKAAPADKDAANKKFQEIAFAYAVLSDDRRRKRYDLTGSTAETLEDDGDFNWLNILPRAGSEEERRDLIKAYKKCKGNLNRMYELVMLSDILEDDDRFRQILDEEIANGNIDALPAYERETDETRQTAKDAEKKRREDYDKREASKNEPQTVKGKANGKAKPKSKKGGADDMAGLAALIQQRQKARAGNFFDALEDKYAPKSRGSKRSTPMDEPPEELFEANRAKKPKRGARTKKVKEEDEDDDMEMGEEDIGESEEEEAPRKSKARGKAKGRGRASAKA